MKKVYEICALLCGITVIVCAIMIVIEIAVIASGGDAGDIPFGLYGVVFWLAGERFGELSKDDK